MKKLSVYGLALLLVLGTSLALADKQHRGDRHPGYQKHHYKQHDNRHHRAPYRKHHSYHPRPPYRYYYYPRHNYWRGYYHYPSYLGAALVGTALTYSLYHTHAGAVCYDDHDSGRYRNDSRDEVVGCHRIERLPDGSERRVEVPLSECQ